VKFVEFNMKTVFDLPIKRDITEKASSEAFLPTASINHTADRDPNRAPRASRLPAITQP
jgi:hypothetical protein